MVVWILALFLIVFVNKKKLVIGIFLISSLINGLHYYISIQNGREGLSILTKETLDDEVSYALIPKKISNNENFYNPYEFKEYSDYYQLKYVGYVSNSASRISYVSYVLFKFFGADFFILKTIICVFFSLLINTIKETFLTLSISLKKANLYAIIIAFIPNLLIRSIQIEKDIILLYVSFLILNRLLQKRTLIFSKLGFYIGTLFFLRPYFAFAFLISKITLVKKLFFQVHIRYQLLILFIASITFISVLNYFLPQIFNLLVAVKNYSVLNGVTDIIEVDYSSVLGIVKTYLASLFYFFFSPISEHVINGSLFWKLLVIEPLLYFLLPATIILFNLKKISNDNRLKFILGISLLIAFIILGFESHFTSVMRKRLFSYILICITAITLYDRYLIFNEKKQK